MKKVFIFGNKGNMGRRYAAILRDLKHNAVGCDVGDSAAAWSFDYGTSDAVIIATNTENHVPIARFLVPEKKPVLCEKPITKVISELETLLGHAEKAKMQLSMVSQYDNLLEKGSTGRTYYNYFKSGNDGLAWDCINIIWHAQGIIELKNESPLWKCAINGKWLSQAWLDQAYITMIANWLNEPYEPQYERILNSHKKVLDYLDGKFN